MVNKMGYGQAGVNTDGAQHSLRLVPHPFRWTNNLIALSYDTFPYRMRHWGQ